VKALDAQLAAVCRRMRGERRVALGVHDKPDTDALGSAAGLLDLFAQLGVEAHLYVAPAEKLPLEGYLLPPGAVVRGMPAAELPLYALDCGAQPRLALERTQGFAFLVDIDHHHDNTRYGDLSWVRGGASSTSEMVCDLARALRLVPSPPAARALYAGISFDSGHFRHASTSAHTLATAAWLAGLGVDVTAVYHELYERHSPASQRLWAQAVLGARAIADGRGMVALLLLADYQRAGAHEDDTEGIAESLRAVEGVQVAALVKEQSNGHRVRVSLRSNGLDVSAVAALRGGGGHRMAAGFSSDEAPGEVTEWLSSELARRLQTASS
jgi:bifunctional oligoribonuclease and PAP phosphatase NrnA